MLNNIYALICISLLGFSFIISLYKILDKFISLKKSNFMISEFATHMAILKYFEEIAFDVIYKKEILVYSVDAWSLGDKDYKEAATKFVKLVIQLLGDKLVEELKNLHGSYSALMDGISLYFYSRIESDEIRKSAVQDLLSDKDLPEQDIQEETEVK